MLIKLDVKRNYSLKFYHKLKIGQLVKQINKTLTSFD